MQKPALVAVKTTSKAKTIVYWIVTALFCLQMSFTAYAKTGRHQQKAADVLGISRRTLSRKLKLYRMQDRMEESQKSCV